MTKILIIYSSIGGNTELVVTKISELLEPSFVVQVQRVDTTKPEDMTGFDLTILASPTYGQGTLEAHFPPFLELIKNQITGKKFAVVGLGDTKYYPEYLTESGQILADFVTSNSGILITPALRIGTPQLKFIDKLVPGWVKRVEKGLGVY